MTSLWHGNRANPRCSVLSDAEDPDRSVGGGRFSRRVGDSDGHRSLQGCSSGLRPRREPKEWRPLQLGPGRAV